ncbi:MAG: MAPEG family protein [Deltaproteobacteria bacterium]|nr:MAPEG family protein [Deltaproteobacteria bacterium]
MTTELWCLVGNALWGLGLVMLEITGKTAVAGSAWNSGNRETSPVFPVWVQRAGRALANHQENFPLFAVAVLVVHLAGKEDSISGTAALAYVAARAVHGVLYVAGVTKLRTLAFLVGLCSVFAILSRLLS